MDNQQTLATAPSKSSALTSTSTDGPSVTKRQAGNYNTVKNAHKRVPKSVNLIERSLITSWPWHMYGSPGISAFPEADNLLSWVGTITGASGTIYEDLTFKIAMKFPPNYPYSPPTVKFETPCYHPNVDEKGNICLDILKEKWSAVYNVQTILLSLQSLLGEPNNESPLNGSAAQLWDKPDVYKKELMKRYRNINEF